MPTDPILRVADRLAPDLRRAFVRAVENLRSEISIAELTELIEQGAFDALTEATSGLRISTDEVRRTLAEAVQASAAIVTIQVDFSLVNERAVRWATANAARLVTEIDSETRRAIARIVVSGQAQGLNPRKQAQAIQSIIGLHSRDSLAVSNHLLGLLDSGFTESQAMARAERMASRLLRRRADNIARTETIRAANMGQQLTWEQAIEEKLLDPATLKRWLATGDERTCPICAVLDGQIVGILGSFQSDTQATAFSRVGSVFTVTATKSLPIPVDEQQPPAHPSCRCTTILDIP